MTAVDGCTCVSYNVRTYFWTFEIANNNEHCQAQDYYLKVKRGD